VEFVSRDDWHKEIGLLLADIQDSRSGDGDGDDGDAIVIPRVAKDKLSAVYGPWDGGEIPSLKIEDYEEPPDIASALDAGFSEISTASLEDFRKQIRSFLDSKCRYWPIVGTVKIRGPFKALECGAKLVDLPGINDPNAAREHVTRTYLKQSQFVWIIFNIKRVLTKDVSNLMQSDDFVRQIVMDGRENALTFVGTASDDIDVDSAWEEFGVDEDCPIAELAVARNEAVRKEITAQVTDIAERLARNADSPDRAEGLRDAFLSFKICTVSARDYLALSKLAKNRPSFDDIDHTEIEQLRQHMIHICSAYGVEAQANTHHARISKVLDEIRAEISRGLAALDQKRDMSAKNRKELGGAISRLSSFLDRDLDDHKERFAQELTSGHDLLNERIKRATERGQRELDHVIGFWQRMHWATLRAVARRGGVFNSPTSGQHDFAADVSKPILDGITFAWTDFFGDRLTRSLDDWSSKLVSVAKRYGLDVLKEIGSLNLGDETSIRSDFKSIVDTTEKVVHELVGQMQTEMSKRIGEVRRTLYEQIPEQVAANMKPAFLAAAEESGTGMKQRMLDRIAKHANRVSRDMFNDIEEHIGEGVRSLTNRLVNTYGDMRDAVRRHVAIPVDHLMSTEDVSAEELEGRRSAYESVAAAIAEMPMVEIRRRRDPSMVVTSEESA